MKIGSISYCITFFLSLGRLFVSAATVSPLSSSETTAANRHVSYPYPKSFDELIEFSFSMNKKAADLTSHEIDLMAEALMKAFDATNPGHMYEAVSADFGGFFDIMGTLQDSTELNSNGDDEESLLRKSWSRHPYFQWRTSPRVSLNCWPCINTDDDPFYTEKDNVEDQAIPSNLSPALHGKAERKSKRAIKAWARLTCSTLNENPEFKPRMKGCKIRLPYGGPAIMTIEDSNYFYYDDDGDDEEEADDFMRIALAANALA